jgi:hypothetical protein
MKMKQSRFADEIPSVLKRILQVKGSNNDFSTTCGPRRYRNTEEKFLSSLLQSLVEVTEELGGSGLESI